MSAKTVEKPGSTNGAVPTQASAAANRSCLLESSFASPSSPAQILLPEIHPVSRLTEEQQEVVAQHRAEVESAAEVRRQETLKIEKESLRTAFEALAPEQKIELIVAAIDSRVVSARTDQINLELIKSFVAGELGQLESPTTWSGWAAGKFDQFFAVVGSDERRTKNNQAVKEEIRTILQETLERDIPKIAAELAEGRDLAGEVRRLHPVVRSSLEQADIYSLDLVNVDSKNSRYEIASKVLSHQRELKDYDRFEESAFIALREEFVEEFSDKISKSRHDSLREESRNYTLELVAANRESWQNPSAEMRAKGAVALTEAQIEGISLAIAAERYRMLEMRELSKAVSPERFSVRQREVWDLYRDVMDPQGEWLNLADKTQDRICEEIAINIPLVLASGGVASVARAGLSTAGRVAVGRVLAHQAIKEGAVLTAKELAVEGGAWATKTLSRRVLTAAAGLGLEATVFETTHLGLRGEWIGTMPNAMERLAFAALTFGALRGASRTSDLAFRRVETAAGRVIVDGAGKEVVQLTRLGKAVEHITDPTTRVLVEHLILKGHAEAASLILVGAAREGYFKGDVRKMFESLDSTALFETYCQLGALKASQRGIGSLSGEQSRTLRSGRERFETNDGSRPSNPPRGANERMDLTDVAPTHPAFGGRPILDILTGGPGYARPGTLDPAPTRSGNKLSTIVSGTSGGGGSNQYRVVTNALKISTQKHELGSGSSLDEILLPKKLEIEPIRQPELEGAVSILEVPSARDFNAGYDTGLSGNPGGHNPRFRFNADLPKRDSGLGFKPTAPESDGLKFRVTLPPRRELFFGGGSKELLPPAEATPEQEQIWRVVRELIKGPIKHETLEQLEQQLAKLREDSDAFAAREEITKILSQSFAINGEQVNSLQLSEASWRLIQSLGQSERMLPGKLPLVLSSAVSEVEAVRVSSIGRFDQMYHQLSFGIEPAADKGNTHLLSWADTLRRTISEAVKSGELSASEQQKLEKLSVATVEAFEGLAMYIGNPNLFGGRKNVDDPLVRFEQSFKEAAPTIRDWMSSRASRNVLESSAVTSRPQIREFRRDGSSGILSEIEQTFDVSSSFREPGVSEQRQQLNQIVVRDEESAQRYRRRQSIDVVGVPLQSGGFVSMYDYLKSRHLINSESVDPETLLTTRDVDINGLIVDGSLELSLYESELPLTPLGRRIPIPIGYRVVGFNSFALEDSDVPIKVIETPWGETYVNGLDEAEDLSAIVIAPASEKHAKYREFYQMISKPENLPAVDFLANERGTQVQLEAAKVGGIENRVQAYQRGRLAAPDIYFNHPLIAQLLNESGEFRHDVASTLGIATCTTLQSVANNELTSLGVPVAIASGPSIDRQESGTLSDYPEYYLVSPGHAQGLVFTPTGPKMFDATKLADNQLALDPEQVKGEIEELLSLIKAGKVTRREVYERVVGIREQLLASASPATEKAEDGAGFAIQDDFAPKGNANITAHVALHREFTREINTALGESNYKRVIELATQLFDRSSLHHYRSLAETRDAFIRELPEQADARVKAAKYLAAIQNDPNLAWPLRAEAYQTRLLLANYTQRVAGADPHSREFLSSMPEAEFHNLSKSLIARSEELTRLDSELHMLGVIRSKRVAITQYLAHEELSLLATELVTREKRGTLPTGESMRWLASLSSTQLKDQSLVKPTVDIVEHSFLSCHNWEADELFINAASGGAASRNRSAFGIAVSQELVKRGLCSIDSSSGLLRINDPRGKFALGEDLLAAVRSNPVSLVKKLDLFLFISSDEVDLARVSRQLTEKLKLELDEKKLSLSVESESPETTMLFDSLVNTDPNLAAVSLLDKFSGLDRPAMVQFCASRQATTGKPSVSYLDQMDWIESAETNGLTEHEITLKDGKRSFAANFERIIPILLSGEGGVELTSKLPHLNYLARERLGYVDAYDSAIAQSFKDQNLEAWLKLEQGLKLALENNEYLDSFVVSDSSAIVQLAGIEHKQKAFAALRLHSLYPSESVNGTNLEIEEAISTRSMEFSKIREDLGEAYLRDPEAALLNLSQRLGADPGVLKQLGLSERELGYFVLRGYLLEKEAAKTIDESNPLDLRQGPETTAEAVAQMRLQDDLTERRDARSTGIPLTSNPLIVSLNLVQPDQMRPETTVETATKHLDRLSRLSSGILDSNRILQQVRSSTRPDGGVEIKRVGAGGDFDSFREYRPGDERRMIRKNQDPLVDSRLLVRQNSQLVENNPKLDLVVDLEWLAEGTVNPASGGLPPNLERTLKALYSILQQEDVRRDPRLAPSLTIIARGQLEQTYSGAEIVEALISDRAGRGSKLLVSLWSEVNDVASWPALPKLEHSIPVAEVMAELQAEQSRNRTMSNSSTTSRQIAPRTAVVLGVKTDVLVGELRQIEGAGFDVRVIGE